MRSLESGIPELGEGIPSRRERSVDALLSERGRWEISAVLGRWPESRISSSPMGLVPTPRTGVLRIHRCNASYRVDAEDSSTPLRRNRLSRDPVAGLRFEGSSPVSAV